MPAPITTELSGSSARNTGRPVSSRSSASKPFKSVPPAREHDAAVGDVAGELRGRALERTLHRLDDGVDRLGKPVENAYVESFIGKLRNECLSENWFLDLHDARRIIEAWRVDYNEVRPHSSPDGMTPKEYAEANRGLTLQVALRRGAGESPSRMP